MTQKINGSGLSFGSERSLSSLDRTHTGSLQVQQQLLILIDLLYVFFLFVNSDQLIQDLLILVVVSVGVQKVALGSVQVIKGLVQLDEFQSSLMVLRLLLYGSLK